VQSVKNQQNNSVGHSQPTIITNQDGYADYSVSIATSLESVGQLLNQPNLFTNTFSNMKEDKMKQGNKLDQGKPDLSHISLEMVELVARVRMFGANKYARSNWKKGFKVTRSCAAALRHIFQFLAGETNDPESGLSHLGHAICSLEHAVFDMKHHPQNDDRDCNEKV